MNVGGGVGKGCKGRRSGRTGIKQCLLGMRGRCIPETLAAVVLCLGPIQGHQSAFQEGVVGPHRSYGQLMTGSEESPFRI